MINTDVYIAYNNFVNIHLGLSYNPTDLDLVKSFENRLKEFDSKGNGENEYILGELLSIIRELLTSKDDSYFKEKSDSISNAVPTISLGSFDIRYSESIETFFKEFTGINKDFYVKTFMDVAGTSYEDHFVVGKHIIKSSVIPELTIEEAFNLINATNELS